MALVDEKELSVAQLLDQVRHNEKTSGGDKIVIDPLKTHLDAP